MIPHKTRRAIKKHHGKIRKVAQELDINPRYVYELLTKGIEPAGTTVRIAMGFKPLPRYKRPRHEIKD